MKKLIVLVLIMLPLVATSQGLLKPIKSFSFKAENELRATLGEEPVLQKWIPRLNTGVMGVSFGKNYGPVEFSALGFGLSYLHYKNVDNVPFNDFGFNLLYLKNTTDNGSGIGIYATYNISDAVGLLNVGTHYDFLIKQFLIDTGVTFHF
jgi:hypothetical protein